MPSSWEDPDHSIARNRASRTHIQDEPTFRQRIGSQHLQREKRHGALCELSRHSTARAHLENKASYLSNAQGTGTETPTRWETDLNTALLSAVSADNSSPRPAPHCNILAPRKVIVILLKPLRLYLPVRISWGYRDAPHSSAQSTSSCALEASTSHLFWVSFSWRGLLCL